MLIPKIRKNVFYNIWVKTSTFHGKCLPQSSPVASANNFPSLNLAVFGKIKKRKCGKTSHRADETTWPIRLQTFSNSRQTKNWPARRYKRKRKNLKEVNDWFQTTSGDTTCRRVTVEGAGAMFLCFIILPKIVLLINCMKVCLIFVLFQKRK